MRHTKGPWTDTRVYKDFQDTPYCFRVYGNNGKTTVHSQKVNGMELEVLANAQLIAAAPDLLEVLKLARKYVAKMVADDIKTVVPPSIALEKIEQAIAKAQGK